MKRFLLFLSVVFAIGIVAKAEQTTVTFKNVFGSSTIQSISSEKTTVNGSDNTKIAEITYQQNQGTDAPAYNKDGSMRLYKPKSDGNDGCSATLTPATGVTITAVSFTFTSDTYALSSNSVTEGTYSSGNWTGTATSALAFTNRGSAQVRIKTLTITYTKEVAGPKDYEQTFADMTLEVGESKVIDLGEEHPETFVIGADDAAIADVVENEGVFTITGKAVGTTKVSVMWEGEGWNEGETEFNVTVNPVLPAPELSFDKAEITEYIGSLEQDLPVLTATEGLKITYSSSNEAVATVNPETGAVSLVAAGTTTITATSEATAEYKAGEASYILNVKTAPIGGYALLTDINNLVDGSVGVIVSRKVNKAVGTYKSKKFEGADVEFSSDMSTVNWKDDASVIEFTFTKAFNDDGSEAGYTIGNNGTYLSGVASSNELIYSETSMPATIAIDENSKDATITLTSGYMILYNNNSTASGGQVFRNYKVSNAGNSNYAKVQIYVAQPAAEVVVPNMVVDGEENAEPVIVFHEGMTIHFNIPEGVRVYRRFVATEEPATPAPARVTGEDGNEYERHTEAYTVPGYGTLSYFAESQGVRSAVKEVRVSDTTGVEDITVGAEEGEAVYYDMTGRRVANPAAGLYIRVNGTTATKVYLR